MENYLIISGFVFGFIFLDVITGYIQAIVNKQVNSSIMRVGIYHKLAEIIALAVILFLNYAMQYLDFSWDIPLYEGFSAALIVMELTSIAENLCKVYPDLGKLPFFNQFSSKGENKDA